MNQNASPAPADRSGKQKIVLLVLAVLALGTVFILPQVVTGPWLAGDIDSEPRLVDSSPSAVSPSTAAESTRYRQDSQGVLAQIIAIRDRLTEQNVTMWAEPEFNQAMQLIETGDELYSYGEYRESLGSYEQALQQFTDLELLGQQKLSDALKNGFEAIESLNLIVATSSSDLANAIAPETVEARTLAGRLEILPQLTEQLEAGDQARADKDLEAAKRAYQSAVDLDSTHKRAADSLSAIKTEIVESRFRGHMSRALAALDSGDYELARSEFNAAGTVYPGHSAVKKGLAQLDNRKSQQLVSEQIRRAGELEAAEEWQQAVEVYEALLVQDSSLTEIQARLIPARVRADLNENLDELIEDPLRLAEQSVYRKAQISLNDALGIQDPGDKLLGQIETLERLLKLAVSPVSVVFQSDNLTNVTLYRVAELGQFEQTSLVLKPGRYIAAGTRRGFRDVRVEFSVTGEPLDGPVVIRCEEPI